MRKEEVQVVEVPATTLRSTQITINCDGCGKTIDKDSHIYSQEAQELRIFLNPEDCVSMARRRDYCIGCLEPIWDAISKLIGADPDQDGTDPPDPEWYIER